MHTNQEYLENLYDKLNENENIQNILIDIEKNKVYFEFDVENLIGDNEYLSLDLSIKKELENLIEMTVINGFENIILSEVIQKKEVTIVDDEISDENDVQVEDQHRLRYTIIQQLIPGEKEMAL